MSMQIGTISTNGKPGQKDAFHVPCVLVKSYQMLKPGQSVKFIDNDFAEVVPATSKDRNAIVDPFIEPPKFGEMFWVLLVPNLTANLSHQFEIFVSDLPMGPINAAAEAEREDYKQYQEEDDGCRGCW